MKRKPDDNAVLSNRAPSFAFYPRDNITDVRGISLAAQGLWTVHMLSIMHDSPHRGYLELANGTPMTAEDIAASAGQNLRSVNRYLAEMERVGIFSRDARGCIFNRRMVKDTVITEARRQAAQLRWATAERTFDGTFAPANPGFAPANSDFAPANEPSFAPANPEFAPANRLTCICKNDAKSGSSSSSSIYKEEEYVVVAREEDPPRSAPPKPRPQPPPKAGEPDGEAAHAAWVEFYDQYPNQTDRERAEKFFVQEYLSADDGPQFARLVMDGLHRWKASASWLDDNGHLRTKYICSLTKFLGFQRKSDEIPSRMYLDSPPPAQIRGRASVSALNGEMGKAAQQMATARASAMSRKEIKLDDDDED
jgi:hypothetical protein